ncbi:MULTISPECIES: type II toxin-antitoxin system VapC family toxin [unclassified Achromobacter]|uniref:type II toxin-antitoxin system VapC family toxin n=1 Tax=unclassified Achromobacter TaxID=2626865 RepID=UPI000B516F52|nr:MULTISPECIES: type II toxin-antitoxin system VapC family toxin [unclassified Achromobacter]OWT79928.1 PIN domain nuclease [Achromobacter sp. HZ34]OWT81812.1 PIN domain nuclease [Achromobacter sp. HZ28]
MNVLLDTHIALWAVQDNPSLTARAREIILSPDNKVHVSVASIWEIGIKFSAGRGEMPVSANQAVGYFRDAGFRILGVDAQHAIEVEKLPWHHKDPFDRLLVAQALTEPMRLLTHDALVARYSDTILQV